MKMIRFFNHLNPTNPVLLKEGRLKEAVDILYAKKCFEIHLDSNVYVSLLQACVNFKALAQGKRIQAHMLKTGFEPDVYAQTKLMIMYLKCGSLVDSCQIFNKLPERNVLSWNAMITGYAQDGDLEYARQVFDKMPERNVVSWNAIIAGYTRNGRIEDARYLFDKMPERNLVSWNAMIAGYAHNEYGEDALKLLPAMRRAGMEMNQSTFAIILSVCADLTALQQGKQVHAHVIKTRFEADVYVGSALVNMYAKCGSLNAVRQVFEEMPERNVVSWNAAILGYAKNGKMEEAHYLFDKMPERNLVSWNSIVAGYAQHGRIDDARYLFDKMPERNVVSWTAMIAGCSQNGQDEEALEIFSEMHRAETKPNQSTFSSVLSACASSTSMEGGRQVHSHIIKMGFEAQVFVANALISMYARCGNINNGFKVFAKMPMRDLVSWTAMIAGYALHGYGKEALWVFEQMEETRVMPDHITFIGVLSACSCACLVHEGWHYLDLMNREYCITPRTDHYACMVDLLGRASCLDEAEHLINTMPLEPDAIVYGALLAACMIHVNVKLGEFAARHLFELEPQNAATYVALSNIYFAVGMWEEAANVRIMMKDRGVKEKPGRSWIEVKNKVHAFFAGDKSHPQTEKIEAMLEKLVERMKMAGYVPDTSCAAQC